MGALFIPDWDELDELIDAGCNSIEVSHYFAVTKNTLYAAVKRDKNMSWTEYQRSRSEKGIAKLKLAQYRKAVEKLHPGLLIWLGKQRLGQTDKVTQSNLHSTIDFSKYSYEELLKIESDPALLRAITNPNFDIHKHANNAKDLTQSNSNSSQNECS